MSRFFRGLFIRTFCLGFDGGGSDGGARLKEHKKITTTNHRDILKDTTRATNELPAREDNHCNKRFILELELDEQRTKNI